MKTATINVSRHFTSSADAAQITIVAKLAVTRPSGRIVAAKLKILARDLDSPHRAEAVHLADELLANAVELDVAGVPEAEDLN